MIPYFQLGTIPLGHHFRLSLFGILLMTAILVGRWRILHLERAEGRSDERIALLCLVMLVFGLICAHVAKIVLADIPAFLAHPAIVLQKRQGIMSLGGFYGGLMAGGVIESASQILGEPGWREVISQALRRV